MHIGLAAEEAGVRVGDDLEHVRVGELRLAWRVHRVDHAGYVGCAGFLLISITINHPGASPSACRRVGTREMATCINDGGKDVNYQTAVMLVRTSMYI